VLASAAPLTYNLGRGYEASPPPSGGFLTPEQHRLSKIQCIGLHNEAVNLQGLGYGGVSVG